jgi:hypothetical protein
MKPYLILGDLFAVLVITLIGFATHGELNISFVARIAAVFFPLALSWFLLAPPLGLFREEITSDPKQLWRPALAMIFAAPLATVLRGLLLGSPIVPIFVIVLSATSALGLTLWRALYLFLNRNSR